MELILYGILLGIAIGMYIASQIEKGIENSIEENIAKLEKDQYGGKTKSGGLYPVGPEHGGKKKKKRTLNELRQVKTYGYKRRD